ncbi:MAG: signal peptidase I [Myxococcota bacterium]|nr:signal peptidase I [Myxococcota bacterium]
MQSALQALYFVAIPALLAALTVEFFVPRTVAILHGPLGVVARIGRGSPVLLGVGLFLVFSALARCWRFLLPGSRYLSALPKAETVEDGQTREGRALEGLAGTLPDQRRRRDAVTLITTIGFAVAIALVLRAGVAEPYSVLSASMLPTLEPGDEIVGNKLAYTSATSRTPRRGDVIVFQSSAVPLGMPGAPAVLIKRVIGLPGDRIRMQGGLPIINGWQIPTCDVGPYIYPLSDGQGGAFQGRLLVEFLEERAYLTVHAATTAFRDDYEVSPGEVFVLGDNRSNSFDSRAWNSGRGGGVPLRAIEARVQWFLVGTHLDGRADWRRALRLLDDLATRLQIEAIDRHSLDEEIARCLQNHPKETTPPSPGNIPPAVPMPRGGM